MLPHVASGYLKKQKQEMPVRPNAAQKHNDKANLLAKQNR